MLSISLGELKSVDLLKKDATLDWRHNRREYVPQLQPSQENSLGLVGFW